MKNVFLLLLVITSNFITGQEGYPVPPESKARLFYIQHSKNHNTYVYDANVHDKKLSVEAPVDVYRITYTKGGIKEELNAMQRKMAYGVTVVNAGVATCSFTLAAYPSKTVSVKMNSEGRPYATVNVNGKNIVLRKLYLLTNKTGTGVQYIDFYGKDVGTGKELRERLYVK